MLEWTGENVTVIPWERLRLSCPCAQCQGEFRTESLDTSAIQKSDSETDIEDVVMMGNYALQPLWRSGHATGIFTWEYLRELAEDNVPI